MNSLVLDVSVAVKWVLPPEGEGHREEAVELLNQHRNGEIRFLVPDIFWAEYGNAMWKAVRNGRMARRDAEEAIEKLSLENWASVPSRHLLTQAFTIANAYDRAIYDSLYVALAVMARTQMITADERLANAMAADFPVKWLGAQ